MKAGLLLFNEQPGFHCRCALANENEAQANACASTVYCLLTTN